MEEQRLHSQILKLEMVIQLLEVQGRFAESIVHQVERLRLMARLAALRDADAVFLHSCNILPPWEESSCDGIQKGGQR